MKIRYILITLLSGTMLLSACQKQETENNVPKGALLLSAEEFVDHNGQKTSVLDNSVQWCNGDVVVINENEYTVIVDEVNHTAYIDPSANPIGTGELLACYPNNFYSYSTLFHHALVFPDTASSSIRSDGRQVITLPMLAHADANGEGHTTLRFYHASAAVKVMMWNTTPNTLTVTKVKLMTDDYRLNALVSYNEFPDPTASCEPQHGTYPSHRYVEVTFPDPGQPGALEILAGDDTKSVQVPIFPIGADNMTIEIYCTDGTHNYLYSCANSCPALSRNQMMTARAKLATGDGNHMSEIIP